MDQILNGIAALEDGVEGGSGVRPTLPSRRCSRSRPSSKSLKARCGAHPLPADREEDMLEEEDEEVRSAKTALQMAVESAAKKRKAATPPRSTGGNAEQGLWVAVTDTGAAAPGNANLGPAPERPARLRGAPTGTWKRP